MYVSIDRADCTFAIRTLSQRLSGPNEDDWRALQKLSAYMRLTSGYATHVVPKAKGHSILQDSAHHDAKQHLLEVLSDSDWCGSRRTSRAVLCLPQCTTWTVRRSSLAAEAKRLFAKRLLLLARVEPNGMLP